MKRGIILITDAQPTSGIERYSFSLFRELKKTCRDISMVSWYSRNLDILLSNMSKYRWLPTYHARTFVQPLSIIFHGLHIVQKYTLYHICNAYLCFLARLLKPSVLTAHDLIFFKSPRPPSDHLVKKISKQMLYASFIICTSKSTEKDLLRFIDVDPKKVRVIYYGVDHELFKPRDKLEVRRKLGLPLDRPIILNVGSEEPRKNIPTLVKAFGILVKDVPNAMLIRVGSPTNTIKKLIHSEGLEGKIVYLRPTDEDLSLLYNASDVFVFPSYYEGLGLPLLEAMASSCPVIAGNRSAIPEAVGDGGILLDPFDVDGFAYWMREILSNEDLRIKLSEKGYRRSMNFSWEKCARETLEVYREVLNKL